MTKETISRTWIAGVIALAAGLVLAGISVWLMLVYGGHFTPAANRRGYEFVPNFTAFFWTMVVLTIVGFTIAAAGGIVQLAAWIGALVNTYQLVDKTWFIVLLVGGIVGLSITLVGFAVMIAYLLAGPDGMAVQRAQTPPPAPQAPTLAPST